MVHGCSIVTIEDRKKDTIRRAWRMQEVEEVPFLIEIGEPIHATRSFLENIPSDLERQIKYCQVASSVDDYFLPNLKPNLGIGVVAAAFGCPVVTDDKSDPWVRPLFNDRTFRGVHDLEVPDPTHASVNSMALDRVEYFQQHSGLPFRNCRECPSRAAYRRNP